MHAPFAPMSISTVQFAKAYRAETRAAEQPGVARGFKTDRTRGMGRGRTVWASRAVRLRHPRVAAEHTLASGSAH